MKKKNNKKFRNELLSCLRLQIMPNFNPERLRRGSTLMFCVDRTKTFSFSFFFFKYTIHTLFQKMRSYNETFWNSKSLFYIPHPPSNNKFRPVLIHSLTPTHNITNIYYIIYGTIQMALRIFTKVSAICTFYEMKKRVIM